MKVKAAVAHRAGEPLHLELVEVEGPKKGEALVEMKATGVCHTDAYTLSGADPEGLFPVILGHEGAGVVVDDGRCPVSDVTDEPNQRTQADVFKIESPVKTPPKALQNLYEVFRGFIL